MSLTTKVGTGTGVLGATGRARLADAALGARREPGDQACRLGSQLHAAWCIQAGTAGGVASFQLLGRRAQEHHAGR